MTIDDFVSELEAPLYVYKMARANLHNDNPAMVKSAKTRMKNSRRQIQDIVLKYSALMEIIDNV